MPRARSGERRQEILETLAQLLQTRRGEPITTAVLAQAVGVSEAALYRHFPSKAKMFEALIEFTEEAIFSRVTRIIEEEPDVLARLRQIAQLLLGFAEKNPGIAAILHGSALVGETERLRTRVGQIFERIETQLRQILREDSLKSARRIAVNDTVGVVVAYVEGRVAHFVRSDFAALPLAQFDTQWTLLMHGLLPSSDA